APRAQAALARLALGARLTARQTEEHASWWVFIAPQGSRQAAARKAGELKDLGVEDYFIVQDESRYRWALSLGVFRNEAAARERLAALRRQGVRSAEIGQREAVVPKVWLQVREVDAALEARLREVASGIEGSELRACPLTS
ncbi:MAG TPA: SPOR domain-containing protein, partial [Burkholderiales bacterium]|nr:SPOR domain-containing protein [Burkholderiales bacterium]